MPNTDTLGIYETIHLSKKFHNYINSLTMYFLFLNYSKY